MQDKIIMDSKEIVYDDGKGMVVNMPASRVTGIVFAAKEKKRLFGKKLVRSIEIGAIGLSNPLVITEDTDPLFEKYLPKLREFAQKNNVKFTDFD